MIVPGKILDDLHLAFQDSRLKDREIKYHPYHRDWIEIVIPRDYIDRDEFQMIDKVCATHGLEYHISTKGRLFHKNILCIYDKTM